MLKDIAVSLIIKGEYRLVRELKKVTAFDARVNLYSDGLKCLYLLDVPIYDKYWELHKGDGTKSLITDAEATDILKAERELNDKVKENALDQIKRVNKFSKFGNIKLDPEVEQELALNPNVEQPVEVNGPTKPEPEPEVVSKEKEVVKPKKKKE
jgi:hypothetical protein